MLDIADKSPMNNQHAAIAIKNGKLFGTGNYNHYRELFQKKFCGSFHAERGVINQLIKQSCIL